MRCVPSSLTPWSNALQQSFDLSPVGLSNTVSPMCAVVDPTSIPNIPKSALDSSLFKSTLSLSTGFTLFKTPALGHTPEVLPDIV